MCVWVRMTEVNSVLVKVKFDRETQSVLIATCSSFNVILILANIVASSPPTPQLSLVF